VTEFERMHRKGLSPEQALAGAREDVEVRVGAHGVRLRDGTRVNVAEGVPRVVRQVSHVRQYEAHPTVQPVGERIGVPSVEHLGE